VSLSIGDFDKHEDNFTRIRYLGPLLDHALDTLVTDLDERGMLNDVMIIVFLGVAARRRSMQKPAANTGRSSRWASWPAAV
jgi:uncharacterized protein (DUF1501 family)